LAHPICHIQSIPGVDGATLTATIIIHDNAAGTIHANPDLYGLRIFMEHSSGSAARHRLEPEAKGPVSVAAKVRILE
jgi:hypothetical protein